MECYLRDFWDLAELEIAKKYVEIRDESFQLCFFCADRPTCSAYHFQIAHQEFCWLMWQLSQMLHHNLVPKHSSWIPKHGNAIMSTLICYIVLTYIEMARLDNIYVIVHTSRWWNCLKSRGISLRNSSQCRIKHSRQRNFEFKCSFLDCKDWKAFKSLISNINNLGC